MHRPGERPRWWRWFQDHRTGAGLTLALAAAAAVRLVNLGALGFNSDEAVYAGQAASLAGNPHYTAYFPIFRAHPMLVQSLLSIVFAHGEHDVAGRVVIALLGVLTVYVVYLVGREIYSRGVGVLGAALLALEPYHVMVSRQVLLDVPMVLFSTVTLLYVAKYAKTGRLLWMFAAGGALGLTMLCKESGIVLFGAIYAFFALTPAVRRPIVGALSALVVAMGLYAIHPISVALSGHVTTAKAYFVWQLLRRPNHTFAFYPETVPWVVGPLVLEMAVVMLIVRWRSKQSAWRELLLVSWMLAPTAAFMLWPVKGFQYLLPIAPPLCLLAAAGLMTVGSRAPRHARGWWRRLTGPGLRPLAVTMVVASLLLVTLPLLSPTPSASGLAGTGGIPGGREAGRWIGRHTPRGSTLMTIGPSMANIIEYYGHRRAYGLAVSPNPLHRNPSYQPLRNPDHLLRTGNMQYLVWDVWSAKRSQHFSQYLRLLARRYHGHVLHTWYVGNGTGRFKAVVLWAVRA